MVSVSLEKCYAGKDWKCDSCGTVILRGNVYVKSVEINSNTIKRYCCDCERKFKRV